MGEDCLKEGTVLKNRYRIDKILGAGGFGITYLAEDNTLRQSVVLKEFFPRETAGREKDGNNVMLPREKNDRKRFLKGKKDFLLEARRMSQLFDIPAIVKILDWFEENDTAYLVMEYLRGISLDRYLQRLDAPLSFGEAWKILEPAAFALEKVHKKGIIHRDLNPDNLMLLENGKIKIIDFGSARKYLDTEKTMTILIKKGYAPPEQYMNRGKQGPWTDVYALCATLYEMITGVRPDSSLNRVQKDKLYLPSAYGAEILPEEEKVLCRGLELDPEKRYRNMTELRLALSPEQETETEKKGFPKILAAGAAAFLVLCVAGAGAFFIVSGDKVQKEKISYAGNYGRQTEKYEKFLDFVKKNALSSEEREADQQYPYQGKSTFYTLDPEAVGEWGEPCNQFRFDKKNEDFLEWMKEKGYSLEEIGRENNASVEIYQYGAVVTDFSESVIYRTEQGLEVETQYDSINHDLFRIYFKLEEGYDGEIKKMMTAAGEFLEQEDAPSETEIQEDLNRLDERTQEEGWMDTQYSYWLTVLENDSGETIARGFGPNRRITDYGWYYWP